MLTLRPYKSQDAEKIVAWLSDELTYYKWGGNLIGEYPLTAEKMNEVYIQKNGCCEEADNFYPWTAVDGDEIVGHFIMRYVGDRKNLRFGWVVVDASKRGKGYGKEMLKLGLKYAFEILKVEQVTIGVFDNNPGAEKCYRAIGFKDYDPVKRIVREIKGEDWIVIELVNKNENQTE